MLRQGATAQLLGLIELRQQQRKNALGLFYDALSECMRRGHGAAIPPLAASLPSNSALGVILGFFSGCLAARGDDWQRAIADLKTAAIGAQHCAALFADDPRLYSIQSQGHIFEDASFLEGVAAQSWSDVTGATHALRPALDVISCPTTTAPFVYLVSCNPLYLRRFGETIAASCEGAGLATTPHFHIVDPDDDTETALRRLRARCDGVTIGWSSESYRVDDCGYRRAGYYACARFLRAREVSDYYGRDVLILDADTEALGDVGKLVAGLQNADLGYFSCGDVLPWLLCRAAAVYIRHTGAGRAFMDLMRKFIAVKVEQEGFWGLDQAALYCASRYCADREGLRFLELSNALGFTLEQFARSASSDVEKQGLRKLAKAA